MAIVAVGVLLVASLSSCRASSRKDPLAATVRTDPHLPSVISQAETVVHSSLDAGDNYHAVWIRDLNTFLQFDLRTGGSAALYARAPHVRLVTRKKWRSPSKYRLLTASKNTTASDQESSLVQAVAQYVATTGDRSVLRTNINGQSVPDDLALALDYVWTRKIRPEIRLGVEWRDG